MIVRLVVVVFNSLRLGSGLVSVVISITLVEVCSISEIFDSQRSHFILFFEVVGESFQLNIFSIIVCVVILDVFVASYLGGQVSFTNFLRNKFSILERMFNNISSSIINGFSIDSSLRAWAI